MNDQINYIKLEDIMFKECFIKSHKKLTLEESSINDEDKL